MTMPAAIDLTGRRFGDLVVIGRAGSTPGGALWRCVCDCGREAVVRGSNLRASKQVSCGRSHAPPGPAPAPRPGPSDATLAIRAAHEAGGVTQVELARRFGVSRQRIHQILKGQ